MNYSERTLRNTILLNLGKTDLGQKQKGLAVGLSQQAVSKIYQRASLGLPISQKRVGATPRIGAEQLDKLPAFLEKGAESYGFTGDYWTHNRVKFVLEKEYKAVYGVKQVGRILAKIGWTRQKPQKKAAQQDAIKVTQWKDEDLPALKKKALDEDYAIYYHDESTLQPCANIVSTYAPKGETPVLSLYDTKGYQYVCIAGSICETGDMFFHIRNTSFKGDGIVTYLKELLKSTSRKIMLIWDNASWHKSAETIAFLRSEEGKRLWVTCLPPYSPELNPAEFVWANLKKVQLPNRVVKNVTELKKMAQEAMTIIKNTPALIKSFFNSENHFSTS